MKSLNCKIATAVVVLLAVAPLSGAAQVGVNTTSPDSTALLDIHFSGTGQVGVLFPNVVDTMRQTKKPNVSDGMVVFDRKRKMFYYYDETLNEWVAMSPFGVEHDDSKLNDIRPQDSEVNNLNMSLGLPNNEKATAKLDVKGNVRVRGNMKVEGSDTVQQNLIVNGTATLEQGLQVSGKTTLQNPTTISSTLTVGGVMTVSSSIDAGSNTITAGTVASTTVNATNGTATVPIGGIIMWSGPLDSWPSNWELCDGSNGTPNLQGRFIVGAGQSYASDWREAETPHYSIGSTGGRNKYALSIDEMPSHYHGGGYFRSGGGDYSRQSSGEGQGTKNSDYAGGSQTHENRPPYYVLAFIMRIY